MNCSDIKEFIMAHGWTTALSKLYVKKPKDTELTVRRRNVENGPDENERQGRKSNTFKVEYSDRERKRRTDKNTARVKSDNKIGDSDICYQTNRRRNRGVIPGELINTSDLDTLSGVTRNLPIHHNNSYHRTPRIRKPLIKNAEASVYYISDNPSIPKNTNIDTDNISILLPNQVDYS